METINATFVAALKKFLSATATLVTAAAKYDAANWGAVFGAHRQAIISVAQNEQQGDGSTITSLAKMLGFGSDTRKAHLLMAQIVGLSLPQHPVMTVPDSMLITSLNRLASALDGKVDTNAFRILYHGYGRDRKWEGCEALQCVDTKTKFDYKAPQNRDAFLSLLDRVISTVEGAARDSRKAAEHASKREQALTAYQKACKEAADWGRPQPTPPAILTEKAPKVADDLTVLQRVHTTLTKNLSFNGTATVEGINKVRALLTLLESSITESVVDAPTPSTPDTIMVSA